MLLDLHQLHFEVSERKKRNKILKIELRFQLFKSYHENLSLCYTYALKPWSHFPSVSDLNPSEWLPTPDVLWHLFTTWAILISILQHAVSNLVKWSPYWCTDMSHVIAPLWAPLTFFFFFFKLLFIIYFLCLFLAVLGLRFCARASSSCGKRGPLFIAVRGPLTIVASLVAEQRLQTLRLSSCGSRAQLLRSMWDLPRPGLEPVSPALAGRFSTTVPPGKPSPYLFNVTLNLFLKLVFWNNFRLTEELRK